MKFKKNNKKVCVLLDSDSKANLISKTYTVQLLFKVLIIF